MQRAFPVAVFAGILAAHYAYAVVLKSAGCGPQPTFYSYIALGDVFIGLSLATGGLFTVSCFRRFLYTRSKAAAAGTVGGTAAVAGVAAAGCFLTGCCGSPMLVVYATILGVQGSEVPKWSVAAVTLVSSSLGWWWLKRMSKCGCTNKSF